MSDPPDGEDPLGFPRDERDRRAPRSATGGSDTAGDEAPGAGDRRGDPAEPGADDAPASRGGGPATAPAAGRPPPGRRARRGPTLGDEQTMAPGNRWLVAVVVLLVLATVGILASGRQRDEAGGGDGAGLPVGRALPAFAAPLATGPLTGDVNVARGRGQGSAGAVPACSVRSPEVLVSCRLTAGPPPAPAALALAFAGNPRCLQGIAQLDRASAGARGVRTAGAIVGGERAEAAADVRRGGWRLPVAHDRDGALAGLLSLPVCPYVVLVGADGRVRGTLPGVVDDRRLARALADLERPR